MDGAENWGKLPLFSFSQLSETPNFHNFNAFHFFMFCFESKTQKIATKNDHTFGNILKKSDHTFRFHSQKLKFLHEFRVRNSGPIS